MSRSCPAQGRNLGATQNSACHTVPGAFLVILFNAHKNPTKIGIINSLENNFLIKMLNAFIKNSSYMVQK